VALNAIGTLVVVGGALFSSWRAWRQRGWSPRLVATLLVALGALVVASGGTLTRLGHHDYLYLAMAPGVCLLLAGYLVADVSRVPRLPFARHAPGAALAEAEPRT